MIPHKDNVYGWDASQLYVLQICPHDEHPTEEGCKG